MSINLYRSLSIFNFQLDQSGLISLCMPNQIIICNIRAGMLLLKTELGMFFQEEIGRQTQDPDIFFFK